MDVPVSVGTKRDYTRQLRAAPGLANGGVGAVGGAGGGGPGGQQENDDDGMDMGGRSTSTPAAEIEEQDVDPRRSDGGGAAEEMDRDGADDGGGNRPPSMTKTQRRHWRRGQNRKKRTDRDRSDVGGPSQGAHGRTTTPNGWDHMAVAQRQNWHKHRRKREIKARAASRDLSRFAR